jgi:ABC-type antimicrobial peptide transport system permease subunit
MPERVQQSLGSQRFALALIGTIAVMALLLAAVGIYGVTAFQVSQGTREIGVRIALGAQRAVVLAFVVRRAMKLVLWGALLGTAGAVVLTRTLANRLYEVSPTDPLTYVVVPLLLTAVAVAAAWGPARRAAKVDPIVALRTE